MSFLKPRHESDRAQQVRLKRQQPAQKRPVAGKKPVVQTAKTTSTVVSRNNRYGTPLRQAAKTQPRRKVYYSVGANGVETRLPSLPIIHFNWQWVSGFLTVGILVLVILLTNLNTFEVKNINVEGITRLTAADLQTIVQSNSSSVFTLEKGKIIDALAIAFPELTDIHLKVSLPDGVKISARERQPILAWKTGKQVIWIDAEGVVMPVRGDVGELLTVKANGTPPLTKPVGEISGLMDYAMMVLEQKTSPLTPEEAVNYLDPTVLKAAIDMSALLPKGAGLVYDSVSGMGWRDPGGWRVYFGNDLTNIQFKQVEYQAILEELNKLGIKPAMVSVENVDSPYYRTE